MDTLIIAQTRKKHKHILEKERSIIEAMIRGGNDDDAIIRTIGCTERTYRRELARGRCEQLDSQLRSHTVYLADFAQRKHDAAARNKGRYAKLNDNPELRKFVETAVKRANYSPYAALEAARLGLEVKNSAGKTVIKADAPRQKHLLFVWIMVD
jgi:IS30 family transposase